MFEFLKKEKKREFAMPKHLTKEEQALVREVIKNAQKDDGVPRTAQQSIPFDRMFQDGICRVGNDYYPEDIHVHEVHWL